MIPPWHERLRLVIQISPFYWGWRWEYNLQCYAELWIGPVFMRLHW